MRTLFALTLALAATQVEAGTLYKCVGPDGVTVYQQTACASAQKEAAVLSYQREPDAPEVGWAGQQEPEPETEAGQDELQQYADGNPIQRGTPRRRAPSINPMSPEAELMRRAEHRAGTPEGRALNRALYGSSQPTRAPNPPAPPPPAQTTVTDQHGNRYQQPAGSAFVTDEKTGRQCFRYGDFLKCD